VKGCPPPLHQQPGKSPASAHRQGASALVIHTEWNPYRRPDFERMKAEMAQALVFDGRNLYDPERMAELGFEYHSVGRWAVGVG